MYNSPLLPGQYYHLYNHAVGNENLFRQHENYLFFLKRYGQHVFPVARTYAYCLMPNHFHLLVQIREEEELMTYYRQQKKLPLEQNLSLDYPSFVMQQFSNFCNSYAKSFNRRFDRKGALFLDYLRRKPVETEVYFTALLAYIHRNPVHHEFCRDASDWAYSSLHSIGSKKPTRLERNAVLDWFGGIEPYIAFHKQICVAPSGEDWEFGF
ncbi:transposase [Spirosoma sp. KNUC1025]|uniref:transposase n=1 Tax=Spirosoma sp. KNUC1025 TaxID=2894082 RepID=UPI00386C6FE6|nr:hypothetical protein LN737_12205 [Spirosoma sp. KNUC1025]